jgi:polyisoprenoid-binding protein YceI
MRYLVAGVMVISLAVFCSQSLAADKYVIDKSHTNVGFSVKHMVITDVKGSFGDFDGYVMFDENDLAKTSAKGTIKVASIDTGVERRDDHLRGGDFFAVDKYPEITFESKRVYKPKDADNYIMVGDITIRGVTKEIEVPFEYLGKVTDPMGKTRIGLHATAQINRQDFGVSWNKVLETGALVVANDVKIELDIEAVKSEEQ